MTAATGDMTPATEGVAAASGPRRCSIARTLDVVGEKRALLAVREVFLGNRRFGDPVKKLPNLRVLAVFHLFGSA